VEKSFKGLKLDIASKVKSKKKKKILIKKKSFLKPPITSHWEFISDLTVAYELSHKLAKKMGTKSASRMEIYHWMKFKLKKSGHISPLGKKSIIPPPWLKDLATGLSEKNLARFSADKWGFEDLSELISLNILQQT